MAEKIIPVRFVYRSASMIPLLSIMEHAGIWKDHNIDVREYHFTDDPLDAEEQLLDGGIDFIFGNHVSPYMRLAQGEPMVCMAQTENWLHQWVATSPEVPDLQSLQNKRVAAEPLFQEDGKFAGHGTGNRVLLLELQGVDTRTVEFLSRSKVGNSLQAVRDGKASACFISPDRGQQAEEAGLRVHRLRPMPMVHSITFTSILPRLDQEPDFGERLMKVLVDATAFFKTRKEESLEIMKTPIGPFREGVAEEIAENYEQFAAEYDTKLYPRAEAIINVHKLACMVYPEAKTVNPLELWDTQTLRRIHATGYVDNLYGGKERVVADIHRVIEHGEDDTC